MPPSPQRLRLLWIGVGGLLLLLVAIGLAWQLWSRPAALPAPGSTEYERYAELFGVGTAALDSDLLPQASEKLTEAAALIPGEPAAWVNRAILHLRGNALDKAEADLKQARSLLPSADTAHVGSIDELLGVLAEKRGDLDGAIVRVEKASAAEPDNVRRLSLLVRLIERQAGPDVDKRRRELLERIVRLQPTSLPALTELALAVARRRDAAVLQTTLDRLTRASAAWDEAPRKLLGELLNDARGNYELTDYLVRLRQLDNLLKGELGYARSSLELSPPDTQVGTTWQQFARLAPLQTAPSPSDVDLSFAEVPAKWHDGTAGQDWRQAWPVWLTTTTAEPAVFVGHGKQVRRADGATPVLPFPGGEKSVAPSPVGVVVIDWNNDGRGDLLLAGAGGLAFYEQQADGSFVDVNAKTKLGPVELRGDYHGGWAVDIDADGDLDVVLARRGGTPLMLRNNGDGTFTPQPIFPGVNDARDFAWADIDNDGAPEAVLLDARGRLHAFANERSGVFRRRDDPTPRDGYQALAVCDANEDGVLDVVAYRGDGKLVRLSDRDKGKAWEVAELGSTEGLAPAELGDNRLVAVDLDNNGSVDLVLRTPQVGIAWLSDGGGKFRRLGARLPGGHADLVSGGADGRAGILGLLGGGKGSTLTRHAANGTKEYHWLDIRPRANPKSAGDKRINPFALGSEAEVRSGTLVTKVPVDRPVIHFGLGARKQVDLVRLQWTNGALQYEFGRPVDAVVTAEQRLIGSCPFLFAWNGERMIFVTDFLWSSPLGMYINAQDKGGFLQTTDWVKVRGDQLVPHDGYLDVRVNANLWETHFIDHLSLVAVDHPVNTEVFVDERFFLTPTRPQVYLTDAPRPVARAWDHHGQDVTAIIRETDGVYLDRAGRGEYQGVTNDHWVEFDLGDDAPREGPVYLLAHGWLHPTDSSINFALEQDSRVKLSPLALEIPDGKGGWKVARPALGFPAGKHKTVVIRLDGLEGDGTVAGSVTPVGSRFRLRTNLEIYWDSLHVARGLDPTTCRQTPLKMEEADLHYRGVLRMTQANPSSPELPHYDEPRSVGQPWRDLIGYHTRYGDVRELLEKEDDRYVIMNGGGELTFRFTGTPELAPGWKRDYVWICDGWVKDGNLNTHFGKTVLPLPWHGMKEYVAPPGRLQDDPVYRRFPGDWQKYHTRFATPTVFEAGLRGPRGPGR
jgi:tetratricopeptide (TPR) repeat protein